MNVGGIALGSVLSIILLLIDVTGALGIKRIRKAFQPNVQNLLASQDK